MPNFKEYAVKLTLDASSIANDGKRIAALLSRNLTQTADRIADAFGNANKRISKDVEIMRKSFQAAAKQIESDVLGSIASISKAMESELNGIEKSAKKGYEVKLKYLNEIEKAYKKGTERTNALQNQAPKQIQGKPANVASSVTPISQRRGGGAPASEFRRENIKDMQTSIDSVRQLFTAFANRVEEVKEQIRNSTQMMMSENASEVESGMTRMLSILEEGYERDLIRAREYYADKVRLAQGDERLTANVVQEGNAREEQLTRQHFARQSALERAYFNQRRRVVQSEQDNAQRDPSQRLAEQRREVTQGNREQGRFLRDSQQRARDAQREYQRSQSMFGTDAARLQENRLVSSTGGLRQTLGGSQGGSMDRTTRQQIGQEISVMSGNNIQEIQRAQANLTAIMNEAYARQLADLRSANQRRLNEVRSQTRSELQFNTEARERAIQRAGGDQTRIAQIEQQHNHQRLQIMQQFLNRRQSLMRENAGVEENLSNAHQARQSAIARTSSARQRESADEQQVGRIGMGGRIFGSINSGLGNIQGGISGTLGKLGPIGIAIGATLGAVTAGIIKATAAADEFKAGMRPLEAMFKGDTTATEGLPGAMVMLREQSKATGASIGDLQKGLFFLSSAGGKAISNNLNEAAVTMGKVTMTSKALQASSEDTTRAFAGTINAMGMQMDKAEDVDAVLNVLTRTFKYGTTTGAELASSFAKAAPSMATISESGIEAVNALGQMQVVITGAGISMDEGSTQIKALTDELMNTSTAAKLSEAGMQGFDKETRKVTDWGALFKSLGQDVNKFTDLMGSDEAKNAVRVLAKNGGQAFTELNDKFNESGKTFNEMGEAMITNGEKLDAAWNDMLINLGTGTSGFFSDLKGTLAGAIGWLSSIFESSETSAAKAKAEYDNLHKTAVDLGGATRALGNELTQITATQDEQGLQDFFTVAKEEAQGLAKEFPFIAEEINNLVAASEKMTFADASKNAELIMKSLGQAKEFADAMAAVAAGESYEKNLEAFEDKADDIRAKYEGIFKGEAVNNIAEEMTDINNQIAENKQLIDSGNLSQEETAAISRENNELHKRLMTAKQDEMKINTYIQSLAKEQLSAAAATAQTEEEWQGVKAKLVEDLTAKLGDSAETQTLINGLVEKEYQTRQTAITAEEGKAKAAEQERQQKMLMLDLERQSAQLKSNAAPGQDLSAQKTAMADQLRIAKETMGLTDEQAYKEAEKLGIAKELRDVEMRSLTEQMAVAASLTGEEQDKLKAKLATLEGHYKEKNLQGEFLATQEQILQAKLTEINTQSELSTQDAERLASQKAMLEYELERIAVKQQEAAYEKTVKENTFSAQSLEKGTDDIIQSRVEGAKRKTGGFVDDNKLKQQVTGEMLGTLEADKARLEQRKADEGGKLASPEEEARLRNITATIEKLKERKKAVDEEVGALEALGGLEKDHGEEIRKGAAASQSKLDLKSQEIELALAEGRIDADTAKAQNLDIAKERLATEQMALDTMKFMQVSEDEILEQTKKVNSAKIDMLKMEKESQRQLYDLKNAQLDLEDVTLKLLRERGQIDEKGYQEGVLNVMNQRLEAEQQMLEQMKAQGAPQQEILAQNMKILQSEYAIAQARNAQARKLADIQQSMVGLNVAQLELAKTTGEMSEMQYQEAMISQLEQRLAIEENLLATMQKQGASQDDILAQQAKVMGAKQGVAGGRKQLSEMRDKQALDAFSEFEEKAKKESDRKQALINQERQAEQDRIKVIEESIEAEKERGSILKSVMSKIQNAVSGFVSNSMNKLSSIFNSMGIDTGETEFEKEMRAVESEKKQIKEIATQEGDRIKENLVKNINLYYDSYLKALAKNIQHEYDILQADLKENESARANATTKADKLYFETLSEVIKGRINTLESLYPTKTSPIKTKMGEHIETGKTIEEIEYAITSLREENARYLRKDSDENVTRQGVIFTDDGGIEKSKQETLTAAAATKKIGTEIDQLTDVLNKKKLDFATQNSELNNLQLKAQNILATATKSLGDLQKTDQVVAAGEEVTKIIGSLRGMFSGLGKDFEDLLKVGEAVVNLTKDAGDVGKNATAVFGMENKVKSSLELLHKGLVKALKLPESELNKPIDSFLKQVVERIQAMTDPVVKTPEMEMTINQSIKAINSIMGLLERTDRSTDVIELYKRVNQGFMLGSNNQGGMTRGDLTKSIDAVREIIKGTADNIKNSEKVSSVMKNLFTMDVFTPSDALKNARLLKEQAANELSESSDPDEKRANRDWLNRESDAVMKLESLESSSLYQYSTEKSKLQSELAAATSEKEKKTIADKLALIETELAYLEDIYANQIAITAEMKFQEKLKETGDESSRKIRNAEITYAEKDLEIKKKGMSIVDTIFLKELNAYNLAESAYELAVKDFDAKAQRLAQMEEEDAKAVEMHHKRIKEVEAEIAATKKTGGDVSVQTKELEGLKAAEPRQHTEEIGKLRDDKRTAESKKVDAEIAKYAARDQMIKGIVDKVKMGFDTFNAMKEGIVNIVTAGMSGSGAQTGMAVGDLMTKVGEVLLQAPYPLNIAGAIILGVGMITKLISDIAAIFEVKEFSRLELAQQREAQEALISEQYENQIGLIDEIAQTGNRLLDQAYERLAAEKAIYETILLQDQGKQNAAALSDEELFKAKALKQAEIDRQKAELQRMETLLASNDWKAMNDFLGADWGGETKGQMEHRIENLQGDILNSQSDLGDIDFEIAWRTKNQDLLGEQIDEFLGKRQWQIDLMIGELDPDSLKRTRDLFADMVDVAESNMSGALASIGQSLGVNFDTMKDSDIFNYLKDFMAGIDMGDIDSGQFSPEVLESIKQYMDQVQSVDEFETSVFEKRKKMNQLRKEAGKYGEDEAAAEEQYKENQLKILEEQLAYLYSIGASEERILEVEAEIFALKKAGNEQDEKADRILSERIRKHQLLLESIRAQTGGGTPSADQQAQISQARADIENRLREKGVPEDEIATIMASLPQYDTGGLIDRDKVAMVHQGELIVPREDVLRSQVDSVDKFRQAFAPINFSPLGSTPSEAFLNRVVTQRSAGANTQNAVTITLGDITLGGVTINGGDPKATMAALQREITSGALGNTIMQVVQTGIRKGDINPAR